MIMYFQYKSFSSPTFTPVCTISVDKHLHVHKHVLVNKSETFKHANIRQLGWWDV